MNTNLILKEYYPTINLLRGIAALMVCIFHFIGYADFRGSLFQSDSTIYKVGELGVNGVFVFFVISGFVIPLSLFKSKFNLKQLPRFLLKRSIRIEIPYIVSIFCILLVGFLFAVKNNTSYTVNGEQFLLHIVYLIPFSDFEWYNVIYWTLAIEFQFYLVIAVLYVLISSENSIITFLTLFVFGISNFIVDDSRFLFHYATIFLQGIILFLMHSEKLTTKIGFSLLFIFTVSTAYLHSIEVSLFCISTVLIIHLVQINNRLTNQFGDISYSLYLTHGLIGSNFLYLFVSYANNTFEKIGIIVVALVISVFFSWWFWKFIENPSKKISKKIKSK